MKIITQQKLLYVVAGIFFILFGNKVQADQLAELQAGNQLAGYFQSARIVGGPDRLISGSENVMAGAVIEAMVGFQCRSATTYQQKFVLACPIDRTMTAISFELPKLKATMVEPGRFMFECQRPNCILFEGGRKYRAYGDVFWVNIRPQYTDDFVDAVRTLRSIRPMQ